MRRDQLIEQVQLLHWAQYFMDHLWFFKREIQSWFYRHLGNCSVGIFSGTYIKELSNFTHPNWSWIDLGAEGYYGLHRQREKCLYMKLSIFSQRLIYQKVKSICESFFSAKIVKKIAIFLIHRINFTVANGHLDEVLKFLLT